MQWFAPDRLLAACIWKAAPYRALATAPPAVCTRSRRTTLTRLSFHSLGGRRARSNAPCSFDSQACSSGGIPGMFRVFRRIRPRQPPCRCQPGCFIAQNRSSIESRHRLTPAYFLPERRRSPSAASSTERQACSRGCSRSPPYRIVPKKPCLPFVYMSLSSRKTP